MVSVDVGDSRDILETIYHREEEEYVVEVIDDREVRVNLKDGGRIIAVRIEDINEDKEEPEPIGTWLVFKSGRETRSTL